MKKNIALLAGGDSPEATISLQSADQMMNILDTARYNVFPIFITGTQWVAKRDGKETSVDKNDFSVEWDGEKIRFDCAYIMIHGTPGENGLLPAYFELLHIPHSTCGPLSGALTFNKYACKKYLESEGISSARAILLRFGEVVDIDAVIETTGLPCFVKPNNGGSSYATSKVKTREELVPAIDLALTIDSEVIIEEFIQGTEVTNGLMELHGEITLFPVTEIVSTTEFFDVEAKYQKGKASEITPARIPDVVRDHIWELSEKIYIALNCKGIVRIDYIVHNDIPCFLEANTVPGMSTASIIPQQLKVMGLNAKDVFSQIIEEAISRGKATRSLSA